MCVDFYFLFISFDPESVRFGIIGIIPVIVEHVMVPFPIFAHVNDVEILWALFRVSIVVVILAIGCNGDACTNATESNAGYTERLYQVSTTNRSFDTPHGTPSHKMPFRLCYG